ncbi:L,D-transpeptidase [Antrihabitans stalactiti]|uniref:L,D-transpeptidase n=1 Tax=Antrihabitans stalactiti TaxID=2584121 RepID=A0A848KGF7_9NOCA|nr:L,D-transpeptidase [Antrihabitans stalactiti]NMN95007.1 L,D-transpeptidase [Antrihabitans stalactiti]
MRSQRLRKWFAGAAVLVGVGSAGFTMTAPAQADPIFPGGPDIPGIPAIIPSPSGGAPCTAAGVKTCLRISTSEAWLMDNGKVVWGPTRISTGQPGYESHVGVFKVFLKKLHHWSTLHNAPMDFAVFFDGDIAFHIGPVDLASHGCIRMLPDAAEKNYNHLNIGDVVEVVA